jgi:hypothetical protein
VHILFLVRGAQFSKINFAILYLVHSTLDTLQNKPISADMILSPSEWLPTFQQNVASSPSGSGNPKKD